MYVLLISVLQWPHMKIVSMRLFLRHHLSRKALYLMC